MTVRGPTLTLPSCMWWLHVGLVGGGEGVQTSVCRLLIGGKCAETLSPLLSSSPSKRRKERHQKKRVGICLDTGPIEQEKENWKDAARQSEQAAGPQPPHAIRVVGDV